MSVNFDQVQFVNLLPDIWKGIFYCLQSQGFTATLVGGTVRDYLLNHLLGHDWDIELTHSSRVFNKDDWKNLGKDLSKFGKVTYLSFEVIRLDARGIQFEFSPPRKEVFQNDWETSGHSNFTAEFDFQLSFDLAVLRRDFTLNAMGIRFHQFKELEFIDPLGGIVHLNEKLLHFCGPDFKKDPVRFLRALRFAQKFQFQMTPELRDVLKVMPVSGISSSYLWSELQKSTRPLSMLKSLFEWQIVKPELKLPLDDHDLNHKWDELDRILHDPSKHEDWILAFEWAGVSAQSWQKFFSLSVDSTTRLSRWAQSSKTFIQLRPEHFLGEFSAVCLLPEFDLLFDWYFTTKQLLQKNQTLPLLKMVEDYLPSWAQLYRFEPLKDVKHIDPPLRAKYQVWNLCQRL
jgi:tRNA nucleotidyltransferase/poly(A) polymerase